MKPSRLPDSHKGENGKVAVVGGSLHQHGAPLFSALSAEAGGCDLVFVCLPACHAVVARMASLNFQVHPFASDELTAADLRPILELLATVDCAVIGPGIARDPQTLGALKSLIAAAPCPLVLDASALQPWTLETVRGKPVIVTPHLGELERMKVSAEDIANASTASGVTILAKGAVDRVASPDGSILDVSGGNAGLTVGGTGDALAGLTASLIAQGMPAADACVTASSAIKKAGELLAETHGYAYTTKEVIGTIPLALIH